MKKMQWLSGVLITVAVGCVAVSGCAPGSMASEGAASGAKSGALGGAVAGAVASIFWGGNVAENIVASAAIGAASGAAMGGASGSEADRKIAEKRAMSERDLALQQKLGADNFEAAKQLALCKHKTAVGKARTAYGTASDLERRKYALMIEAMADEESGDTAAAAKVYPLYASIDPAQPGADKVRADALAALLKVQQLRVEHGKPATCS
jgi:hypothetical protein